MKTIGRLLFGICFLACGYLSIPLIWLHIVAPNLMIFLIGFIAWTVGWHEIEHRVVFPWVGVDWDRHPRAVVVVKVMAVALSSGSVLTTLYLISLGAWITSIPFILLAIFGAYFYYLESVKVQNSSSITIKEET